MHTLLPASLGQDSQLQQNLIHCVTQQVEGKPNVSGQLIFFTKETCAFWALLTRVLVRVG